MKITTTTQDLLSVLKAKIAKITSDINEGQAKAKRLEPEAETSEATKKALQILRASIDRAEKLRASMAQMSRSVQLFDVEADVELNDNECGVLGYVDTETK